MFFDSSYRTSVSAVSSRVIPDNAVPQSIKTGMIKAILQEGSVSEYVLDELVGGIALKAERMYAYGRDKYTYGLPSSTVVTPGSGSLALTSFVHTLSSNGASIDYYHYGILNHMHYGWKTLYDSYGYTEESNVLATLSAIKGTPVYLKDMQSVVTEASLEDMNNGSLAFWGSSPLDGATPQRIKMLGITRGFAPLLTDVDIPYDLIRVTYTWVTGIQGAQVIHEEYFDIPIPISIVNSAYVHIKYHDQGIAHYFLYQAGQGVYPTLDSLYTTFQSLDGSYFPNLYFRIGKTSMSNIGGSAYAGSVALAKTIGIEYADVLDSVNANPGINDVEQALITMAVPAVTSNQIELKYLYDFFSAAYVSSRASSVNPADVPHYQDEFTVVFQDLPKITLVIQDAILRTTLGFNGIYRTLRAGVIGPVGFNTFSLGTVSYPYQVAAYRAGRTYIPEHTAYQTYSTHTYCRQITASVYVELRVVALRMAYDVHGLTVLGTKADAILMVPIDRALSHSYPMAEKEILYSRGLHYIFTSYTRTEVAWYQQSWFGDLLMIAAVVVSVSSMFSDGGSLVALVAAGTITIAQAALVVAMQILTMAIKAAIASLFIQAVGIKVAFVVAIVAALAGAYQAYDAGSIKGAPWAKELLEVSTGLSQGVNEALRTAFADLTNEATTFSVESEAKQKEIDAANALMAPSALLEPFVIFGESPKDYFNRTVHAGNMGVAGIDAVSAFVEVSLTLPTLSQSTGEFSYGV